MPVIPLHSVTASLLHPGFLAPCLAPLIVKLGGAPQGTSTFNADVRLQLTGQTHRESITIQWDTSLLLNLEPNLARQILDLKRKSTPIAEHVTEFAAYASAMCAVAGLMPSRVITHMNVRRTPDLWLGLEERAGIEVAGRDSGAASFHKAVRVKRAKVKARAALDEGYISIWAFDLHEARKERVV